MGNFIPNPCAEETVLFCSGDRGYQQQDGQFLILGRINKQGGNMTMEKVEQCRKKQDYILEFLSNEGYRPSNDDEGDIEFKKEGSWYFITLFDNDEQYYRILKPTFWPIENAQELEWAWKASNKSTGGIKVAKVFVTDSFDNVAATAECFQPDVKAFTQVFGRLMSALSSVHNEFVDDMLRMAKEMEDPAVEQITLPGETLPH